MTGDVLNQRLDSILGFIETSVKSGAEFAREQAPDIIQQVLAWGLWSNVATVVWDVAIVVAMVFAIKYLARKCPDIGPYEIPWPQCSIFGAVVVSAFAIGSLCFAIANIIQILVAPKLYLIEYTSSLLTK